MKNSDTKYFDEDRSIEDFFHITMIIAYLILASMMDFNLGHMI